MFYLGLRLWVVDYWITFFEPYFLVYKLFYSSALLDLLISSIFILFFISVYLTLLIFVIKCWLFLAIFTCYLLSKLFDWVFFYSFLSTSCLLRSIFIEFLRSVLTVVSKTYYFLLFISLLAFCLTKGPFLVTTNYS